MEDTIIQSKFNLTDANPGTLFVSENFEAIKYQACDLIYNLDWEGAVNYSKVLEEKLNRTPPRDKSEAYISSILLYWVFRLKLFAFIDLSTQEKQDLLKKNAAKILASNLDLRKYIFKYIDFYDSPGIITDETKNFISSLNQSHEIIGKNTEAFAKVNFKPFVSSWIKEYQAILKPLLAGKLEPGAFHIVKFMDSSQYVKFLTQEEKNILRELLDLYNWLSSPIIYNDEKVRLSSVSYTNQQTFQLPPEAVAISEPIKQPPVVPLAPKPQLRPIDDIESRIAQQPDIRPAVSNKINKPLILDKGGRAVNIQDILKKRENDLPAGLRMGGQRIGESEKSENQKSDSLVPQKNIIKLAQESASKQADIDKKLQDLENRVKDK